MVSIPNVRDSVKALDSILGKLIEQISLPVWIFVVIWRNKALRSFLVVVIVVSYILFQTLGFQIFLTLIGMLFRMVFAILFIMIQFVGLFWFLSRTKVIETIPGDEGTITFDDYFGNEHLVKLVKEWVELLTDGRNKLDDLGGKALSGLLLIGPPGTGKTMLARCLAGSAHSAFIGMSGSDFTSMFLGVGVLKVRGMFNKARKWAKAFGAVILFVDEIDAIAGNRGSVAGDRNRPVQGGMAGGMFGGGGLGVMSRLLVEMDGISEISLRDRIQNRMRTWIGLPELDQGVVLVMAASNRPDALDPAILRPGRLDRRIHVGLPDKGSRRAIIEGYLNKVKHVGIRCAYCGTEYDERERHSGNNCSECDAPGESIDVDYLVSITSWASPALLASAITKDAARLAIFDGRRAISQQDIENALQENALGLANPISDLEPEQKYQIAVHEAGHAIAVYYLKPETKIARVSIVRRSGALGYVMPVEKTDLYTIRLTRFVRDIMVSLAGHVATEVILNEAWTGATGDLTNVRNRVYVLAGLGFFGSFPLASGDPLANRNLSEKIDEFINNCMNKTRDLLELHRKELEAVADALVKDEDLSGDTVIKIIEGLRVQNS